MSERNTLEFDALPLVETHFRVVFEPPVLLDFNTGRVLAEKMEALGFGDVRNEDVLRQLPGQGFLMNIPTGPFLALSFRASQGLRIRVQPDMIEAEWLKAEDPTYPRYPMMLKAILDTVGSLLAIQPEAKFTIANISYSNLIDLLEQPTIEGLNAYFEFKLDVPGSGKHIHQMEIAWTGEIDHRITIQSVGNRPSEIPTKAILTNTAGVRLASGNDLTTELTRIHDFLVSWFFGLLTDKAKHEFKYRG